MFGRRSSKHPDAGSGGATAASVVEQGAGGKGRPTPTRREAEAARKQRLTPPRTRKEAAAANRRARSAAMSKQQEALRTGDERYLPARDKGPVRRYCRDVVDARRNAAEYLLPVLLVILVLGAVPATYALSTLLWLIAIIAPVIDSVVLSRRLRADLATYFPGESTRSTTSYALLRSAQVRRWRMPKPQVERGVTVTPRRR